MGHYAVDFQCPSCGKLRCTCPPKPDPVDDYWVITDDLEVMHIEDYKKQLKKEAVNTQLKTYFISKAYLKLKFETKECAEEELQRILYARVVSALEDLEEAERAAFKKRPTTAEKLATYEAFLNDVAQHGFTIDLEERLHFILEVFVLNK